MTLLYEPAHHECAPAFFQTPPVGSIARCDECGQHWVLRDVDGPPYWARISERRARRILRRAGVRP